jgi:hypothetical protein
VDQPQPIQPNEFNEQSVCRIDQVAVRGKLCAFSSLVEREFCRAANPCASLSTTGANGFAGQAKVFSNQGPLLPTFSIEATDRCAIQVAEQGQAHHGRESIL